jgi:predicted dehydrogenase
MSVGVAVVGTGFIGPVHVEALRRLGRPVIGVLGSTPQKSQTSAEALGLFRGYASFEELLADSQVGVVHLASPNRLHFEQCKQAIAAGKHVLCEKPLAMTAVETAKLAALAQAAPVVTAVCYNVRFYPMCLEARQQIASGAIGRIFHVTGSYVQDWLHKDTDFNWRVLAEEGGALRAVADIGTHWMDLVQFLTGDPIAAVCADLATIFPLRKRPRGSVETFQSKTQQAADTEDIAISTEDYGSILFRCQSGARGCFTVSQVMAGRKNAIHFELAGSQAGLSWHSERPNELWIGHRDRPNETFVRDPALLHPSVHPFADYPGGHNEGFPDTFKQLFKAVYRYIDAGDWKAPRDFPTFADGHREVLLCEAILRSQRDRGWVDVVGTGSR